MLITPPSRILRGHWSPKSVIGKRELNRLLRATNKHSRDIRRSGHRFRFGDESFPSLGRISLPLATPSGIEPIFVDFDIGDADIPALLGMDVLDGEQFVADTVFHRLARRSAQKLQDGRQAYFDEWFIPLMTAKSRHVYVPIATASTIHFTES